MPVPVAPVPIRQAEACALGFDWLSGHLASHTLPPGCPAMQSCAQGLGFGDAGEVLLTAKDSEHQYRSGW